MSQNNNLRRYMDFGNVVLEHRPVVICQCKFHMCAQCNVPEDEHDDPNEDTLDTHKFYQRLKVYGPRVVIHQDSHMGICNDCGKLYQVSIAEIMVSTGQPIEIPASATIN